MKAIKFLLLAIVLGASFVSVEAVRTRKGAVTGRDWTDARQIVPHSDRDVVEEAFAAKFTGRLGDDEEVTGEACHKRAIRVARAAIAWVFAAGYNKIFGAKAE